MSVVSRQEAAMDIEFDYTQLSGRIKEKIGTRKNLAKELGISEMTMWYKMHNRFPFTQSEILGICKLLNIPKSKIPAYFFTTKVL